MAYFMNGQRADLRLEKYLSKFCSARSQYLDQLKLRNLTHENYIASLKRFYLDPLSFTKNERKLFAISGDMTGCIDGILTMFLFDERDWQFNNWIDEGSIGLFSEVDKARIDGYGLFNWEYYQKPQGCKVNYFVGPYKFEFLFNQSMDRVVKGRVLAVDRNHPRGIPGREREVYIINELNDEEYLFHYEFEFVEKD